MKKLSQFFKILTIVIIFDLFFTFLFISKLNFYEIFYPNMEHRISNKIFHHSFKENADTYDYWGGSKYKFITNSLGFKDNSKREIKKLNKPSKRIIINGDSFTEGIGFEYDDTFVGLLDKELKDKDIEILNAGVASQSPILYLKKIEHLIKIKEIELDELIIFLDISDIADEFFYNEEFQNTKKIKKLRDTLQNFFFKNSSVYLFLDAIFFRLNQIKESIFLRLDASNYFNLNFLKITKDKINLYKAINVERGNWTHDNDKWNNYGKKGRQLAEKNLDILFKLCKENNISFNLIIYPWPSQIYLEYELERHRIFWKNWSLNKNIKFIDLFKYFEGPNPSRTIDKYFIAGDVHWNKEGHKLIYNIMMKEYFNKN